MGNEYAKECINAEDVKFVLEGLRQLSLNQSKYGAYERDIISTKKAKDAINNVLSRASFDRDEICFYVSPGTKKMMEE